MKMKKYILLIITLFVVITSGFSQKVKISGVVTDAKEKLIGVNVTVKDQQTGTITDINGRFVIEVPINSKLVFSYVGYLTKEVAVTDASELKVELTQISTELDDVVVIGYGTMKKRDITGAVTSLNSEVIQNNTPTDMASALQGKIAGFEVISNSGDPGDASRLRIRGTSTFSDEGASPLFIVDGVEVTTLDGINPQDIASIEVLKDAASAAIYGSRSANGVVLVTTKSGYGAVKPVVNVSYSLSLSRLAHKLPQMTRLEGKRYDMIRQYFSGVEDYTFDADSVAPNRLIDNDYQDILFRNAPINHVNASLYGSGKQLNYYVSVSWLDQQGIMLNTYNKRLATRSNVNYQVTDKLKIGSRINISNRANRQAPYRSRNYLGRPADYQMVEVDGSYSPFMSSRSNPLAYLLLSTDLKNSYEVTLNEYAEYEIIKGLTLRSSVSANILFSTFNSFYPKILSDVIPQVSRSTDQTSLNTSWTHDDVLTYQKNIKNHSFNLMGGFNIQSWQTKGLNLSVLGHPIDAAPISIGYSDVNLQATNATSTENRLVSYFGRFSYSYFGRYLLNANIRADGSSRFGQNKKWGTFPSLSLGWRFSDEQFMSWAKPVLYDSKLRMSYGVTGNQSAGNFASLALYRSLYYGDYNGIYPSQIANADLGWEQTTQYNAGLDVNLWRGRVILAADYYYKKTTNVLYSARLPQTSGFASSYKNVGAIDNDGIEISISTINMKTRHFKWSSQLNMARNTNMVVSIPDGGRMLINDNLYLVDEGYAIGTIYGYKKLAIFPYTESNAFTPEGVQLTPVFDDKERFQKYKLNGQDYTGEVKKLRYNSVSGDFFEGGDVLWDDVNGDFIIDAEDRQVIGNAQPWFNGGFTNDFTYNNLTLSLFFAFSAGGDIFNQTEANRSNHMWSSLTRANPLNVAQSWLAPGDIAKYPKPNEGSVRQNTRRESSMWVEDGSYIKLKNVRLAYNFPNKLLKKVKIDKLEVFGQMKNWFVWTKYTGQDPELGGSNVFVLGYDDNTYPRAKDIQFGVNLTF